MSIINRSVSRPFHIIDAPVPENLRLQFIYNFFEADEKERVAAINTNGTYARAFKLEWSPLEAGSFTGTRTSMTLENSELSPRQSELYSTLISSQDPILSVNYVDSPTITRDSSFISVQDFNFDSRVADRLKESSALRGLSTGSAADTAASVRTILGDSFDQRWLNVQGTVPETYEGLLRASAAVDSDANDESFQLLVDNERARAAFREFTGSPASRAAYDAFDSLKSLFVSTNDAPTLEDVETVFEGIEASGEGSRASPPALIGYMIEKFSSVATDPQPARFVVKRGTKSYLDTDVVYGQTYTYRVRTICAIYNELTIESSTSTDVNLCLVPFLSDPSRSVSLTAAEMAPPPSPADFNLLWNYQDSTLQLLWSFPNNTQRDIKYWQVFRRRSINEAYSLIRMIDFDDSTIRSQFPETVDPTLISKFQNPVNFYVDPEFNKDSDYIYTVCSVDAHGQSSNYGMQFRVRFDRYKNKLVKELISASGAAKQYPNTYINAELTLDSVKSSGASKMRIYFDPEYLVVTDSDDRDQFFLRPSPAGLYQLQLINVDRQKQADISISIVDSENYISAISPST